ncbi:Cell division control protein 25 [Golovinomyces cichoracearum]|uniref:Class E vacuolar protein-sorting machinery protein HSE1 n=1 Tax=Golovinomyces cichoracearum TaxID=62708 RepID=A0A420J285_9PEZI|nr:Cell division control protein 25 [Golovinomyces cichoracearum]
MNGILGNAPLSVMFVRALYDYETDDRTSLSFREGDVIQVITQLDSGWWDGIINGVRGWFPSNYCQVIRTPDETAAEKSKAAESSGEQDELEVSEASEEYDDQYDDEADSEREDFTKQPVQKTRAAKNWTRADFWIPQVTSDGRIFYYNTETGESSSELPVESPTPEKDNSRNRLKISMPEKTKLPSEWRAKGYLHSDSEEPGRASSLEHEREKLKVQPDNYHSRQRSNLSENTLPPLCTEPAYESSIPIRTRRDPSISNPAPTTGSSSTATQLITSPLGTSQTDGLSRSIFDDSLSINLTWNRLVTNMKRAVNNYRDAINNNERSEYVRRAEEISDHLRLLLAAGSGTTDNHSGQPSIISTNKALYPHFRDMMSKFSKLVISSHIAAADWPNAESYQKCLQEAEGVLQGVFCYVEVARQQRGEHIPRILPGFIVESTRGGNWQNNGLGTRDLLSPKFLPEDEGILEPSVPLNSSLIDCSDELKRVLVSHIRKLEEDLVLTEKIITPFRHEIIGNKICSAAKKVLESFKSWISTIESINLSPLGSSLQNPQLTDFSALKQGLYDSISDLLMSCQAVTAPLGDEWVEMRGEPLEARLTHVRLSAKLLETKMSQVAFSLQLLCEQIQIANEVLPLRESTARTQESRRTESVPFVRPHHKRTDSRINAGIRTGATQAFAESESAVNSRKAENSKVRKFFGEEPSHRDPVLSVRPEQTVPHIDETPDCLRLDHEDDISYDLKTHPPQLKGGTLIALVEQLTRHDKLDSNFNNTFLLTYRSFTTAHDLFFLLVQRFQIQPPAGIAQSDYEVWRDRKQRPIRFRVVNILKSWFENFWMEDQSEEIKALIREVYTFARDTVKTTETPGSTPLMTVLEQRLRGQDTTAKRLILNMNQSTPQPIIPKNMKKLKFLDIDPTEFARQLTIIESKLYGKIKPTECLNKTWQKKVSEGDPEPAPNVKALILHSNQLTNWVAEVILTQLDVKKRVGVIKHFVSVADKCRQLNNYSTLTSIISALGTAPIHRLKRTWDQIPAKTLGVLESMRRLMGSTKNFGEYRESLHLANPPCLPFFGVYLTDLTFIEDGIPSIIKKSALINFAKRAKTAEVIRDIQQYQNVPYALQPVIELQEYILSNMQVAGDVHEMYEKSLAVEPREREDEKIVRVLAESGFL